MKKMVIFSDLHYAPEKPINNGSIIERKLGNMQNHCYKS